MSGWGDCAELFGSPPPKFVSGIHRITDADIPGPIFLNGTALGNTMNTVTINL